MFTPITHPIIFAHRGASAHAPENTLAAFNLGIEQGADAIELDTKLSLDGVVVVIHDATVDRTTDGTGLVHKLSLPALKEFDAGLKYHEKYRGERIPTLDEVFESVGRRTIINVELTNYRSLSDMLPEKVSESIIKHNIKDRVLFSSFSRRNLRRVQHLSPSIPVGFLALPGILGIFSRSKWGNVNFQYQALHPATQDVTSRLVDRQHQAGRRVHVYTVNDPNDMQRLFALGVDGIFTDDPLLARNNSLPNKPIKEETDHVR